MDDRQRWAAGIASFLLWLALVLFAAWVLVSDGKCGMRNETFALKNPPRRGAGYDNTLETPASFFALVDAAFGPYDLDVCASAKNAKCGRFFTAVDDCLAREWGTVDEPSRGWANPPYAESLIGPIVEKGLREALAGRCSTTFLFPVKKSEQGWFHECVLNPGGPGATAIFFVQGRIDFWRDGAPLGAPNHASLLVDFQVGRVNSRTRAYYAFPTVGSFHRYRGLKA